MADSVMLTLSDLESLQLEMEVEMNLAADANALPTPVKAGFYVGTLEHVDPATPWESKTKGEDAKSGAGTPYLNTELLFTIVENPANPKESWNRKIVCRNVMTMIREMGGAKTSQVQGIMQALDRIQEFGNGPQDQRRHAILLSKALQSKPMIGANVEWEASFYDKDQKKDLASRKRRMRQFPVLKDGSYSPVVTAMCIDGVEREAEAQNYIRTWVRPSEVMKGTAKEEPESAETAESSATPIAPRPKKKIG